MATKRPPPAAKRAQKGTSRPAEAKKPQGLTLAPTETPGVFRNSAGILVNKDGVALSLLEAKKAEGDDLALVLDGQPVKTPAQFLKALSLDPRVPVALRVEAAKAAAPYTDRKMPQGLDGGIDPETGKPLPIKLELGLPPEVLAKLSESELATFDKVLGLLREHGLLKTDTPS